MRRAGGTRTHERKLVNPGGARPEQYIYAQVHPKISPALRDKILARDHHACQIAVVPLFDDVATPVPRSERRCRGQLEVHHRIRVEDGGNEDETNLITLCKRHHALKHQMMRTRVRAEHPRRWLPS